MIQRIHPMLARDRFSIEGGNFGSIETFSRLYFANLKNLKKVDHSILSREKIRLRRRKESGRILSFSKRNQATTDVNNI